MNPPNKSERPEYDADVSLLLYKTGRSFKQFFIWLGKIFTQLGKSLATGLLFLMRNIVWLIAGTLLGLGYGYFQFTRNGAHFVAEMTAKANFNSSRALYSTVDYVNSLIANGQVDELGKLFNISREEARQLVEFSANAVESELMAADIYQQQFMQYDRTAKTRQDTFWLKTLKYSDFKKSLTKYDYPYHEIRVVSTNPSIFPRLEKGMVDYISRNELLQDIKNRQAISNNDEEKLIATAIENIDTLRRVYNERLKKGQPATLPSGNQMTILESKPEITTTPELDLF